MTAYGSGKFHFWLRITAMSVLVCYLVTQTGFAEPTAFLPQTALPSPRLRALPVIPPLLGAVKFIDSRKPSSSSAQIILIEDAHAVIDAQDNIAKILLSLEKSNSLDAVFLEGAAGIMDAVLLQTFPNQKIKTAVLRKYLESGELGGAEMAAAQTRSKTPYLGMEDWTLYQKNYEAYRQALAVREQALDYWESEENRLFESFNAGSGSGLKAFLEVLRAYDQDKINTVEWLKTIRPFVFESNLELNTFPELRRLMKFVHSRKKLEAVSLRVPRLIEEIDRLRDQLLRGLCRSDEERGFAEQYHRIALSKKMTRLELSLKEWRRVRRIRHLLLERSAPQSLLQPALQFYERSIQRENAFVKNIEAGIRKQKASVLTVVAGGFHTEGLRKRLMQRGHRVIAVTPRMRSANGSEYYEPVMQGRLSYRHHSNLSLHEAFLRRVAEQLVQKTEWHETGLVLKNWRDDLLCSLAERGAIDSSSRYIRIIDSWLLRNAAEESKFYEPKHFRNSLVQKLSREILDYAEDAVPPQSTALKTSLMRNALVAPRTALFPGLSVPWYREDAAAEPFYRHEMVRTESKQNEQGFGKRSELREEEHLSESAIEARMARDGFEEMRLLWNKFLKLKMPVAGLQNETIEKLREKHMGALSGRPGWMAAISAVFSGLVIWGMLFLEFVDISAESQNRLLGYLFLVLGPLGLLVSFWFFVMHFQRDVVHPLYKIMGMDLAWMLSRPNFRVWHEKTARAVKVIEELGQLGVNDLWDNPAYRVKYRLKRTAYQKVPFERPFERIQRILKEVLGHFDPEARKYHQGPHFTDLKEGKTSITHYVTRFKEEIEKNKKDQLTHEERLSLLQALLEIVKPDSKAHRKITEAIRLLETGSEERLSGDEVSAEIWQRDPWVDLTYQDEFFSSASLRGVKFFGKGPDGRLGTFGYLRNKSFSALDFRTDKGRVVRARIGAAKNLEATSPRAILFVDGVEGTTAVSMTLIQQAIEDYARAAGFEAVFYSAASHNVVPKKFIRHLNRLKLKLTAMKLRYLDDSGREYLDSFGIPLFPYEYAYPRGTATGYLVHLKDPQYKPRPPTLREWIRFVLKHHFQDIASYFLAAVGVWSLAMYSLWALAAVSLPMAAGFYYVKYMLKRSLRQQEASQKTEKKSASSGESPFVSRSELRASTEPPFDFRREHFETILQSEKVWLIDQVRFGDPAYAFLFINDAEPSTLATAAKYIAWLNKHEHVRALHQDQIREALEEKRLGTGVFIRAENFRLVAQAIGVPLEELADRVKFPVSLEDLKGVILISEKAEDPLRVLFEETFHRLEGIYSESSRELQVLEVINDLEQLMFYDAGQLDKFVSPYSDWTQEEKLALVRHLREETGLNPYTGLREIMLRLLSDVIHHKQIRAGGRNVSITDMIFSRQQRRWPRSLRFIPRIYWEFMLQRYLTAFLQHEHFSRYADLRNPKAAANRSELRARWSLLKSLRRPASASGEVVPLGIGITRPSSAFLRLNSNFELGAFLESEGPDYQTIRIALRFNPSKLIGRQQPAEVWTRPLVVAREMPVHADFLALILDAFHEEVTKGRTIQEEYLQIAAASNLTPNANVVRLLNFGADSSIVSMHRSLDEWNLLANWLKTNPHHPLLHGYTVQLIPSTGLGYEEMRHETDSRKKIISLYANPLKVNHWNLRNRIRLAFLREGFGSPNGGNALADPLMRELREQTNRTMDFHWVLKSPLDALNHWAYQAGMGSHDRPFHASAVNNDISVEWMSPTLARIQTYVLDHNKRRAGSDTPSLVFYVILDNPQGGALFVMGEYLRYVEMRLRRRNPLTEEPSNKLFQQFEKVFAQYKTAAGLLAQGSGALERADPKQLSDSDGNNTPRSELRHDDTNDSAKPQKKKSYPKSYFGRDGQTLNQLTELALKELKSGERLRVLTIGSSIGHEGYDIAMAAIESMLRTQKFVPVDITITDIEPEFVEVARRGIYSRESVFEPLRERQHRNFGREVTDFRARTFFTDHGPDSVRILSPDEFSRQWNVNIHFQTLDITDAEALSKIAGQEKFNLIIARHVHYDKEPDSPALDPPSWKVLNSLGAILKPQGLVEMTYGYFESKINGDFFEGALGALRARDIRHLNRFRKRAMLNPSAEAAHHYPQSYHLALGLKMAMGLRRILNRHLRQGLQPHEIIAFIGSLESFFEQSGYFPQSAWLEPVIPLFALLMPHDRALELVFEQMRWMASRQVLGDLFHWSDTARLYFRPEVSERMEKRLNKFFERSEMRSGRVGQFSSPRAMHRSEFIHNPSPEVAARLKLKLHNERWDIYVPPMDKKERRARDTQLLRDFADAVRAYEKSGQWKTHFKNGKSRYRREFIDRVDYRFMDEMEHIGFFESEAFYEGVAKPWVVSPVLGSSPVRFSTAEHSAATQVIRGELEKLMDAYLKGEFRPQDIFGPGYVRMQIIPQWWKRWLLRLDSILVALFLDKVLGRMMTLLGISFFYKVLDWFALSTLQGWVQQFARIEIFGHSVNLLELIVAVGIIKYLIQFRQSVIREYFDRYKRKRFGEIFLRYVFGMTPKDMRLNRLKFDNQFRAVEREFRVRGAKAHEIRTLGVLRHALLEGAAEKQRYTRFSQTAFDMIRSQPETRPQAVLLFLIAELEAQNPDYFLHRLRTWKNWGDFYDRLWRVMTLGFGGRRKFVTDADRLSKLADFAVQTLDFDRYVEAMASESLVTDPSGKEFEGMTESEWQHRLQQKKAELMPNGVWEFGDALMERILSALSSFMPEDHRQELLQAYLYGMMPFRVARLPEASLPGARPKVETAVATYLKTIPSEARSELRGIGPGEQEEIKRFGNHAAEVMEASINQKLALRGLMAKVTTGFSEGIFITVYPRDEAFKKTLEDIYLKGSLRSIEIPMGSIGQFRVPLIKTADSGNVFLYLENIQPSFEFRKWTASHKEEANRYENWDAWVIEGVIEAGKILKMPGLYGRTKELAAFQHPGAGHGRAARFYHQNFRDDFEKKEVTFRNAFYTQADVQASYIQEVERFGEERHWLGGRHRLWYLSLQNGSPAAAGLPPFWIREEQTGIPEVWTLEDFQKARRVLAKYVRITRLAELQEISRETGKLVFLKNDAQQINGSFKARGVYWSVYEHLREALEKIAREGIPHEPIYVVTQSTGNHGIATIAAVLASIQEFEKIYADRTDMLDYIRRIEPIIFSIKNTPRVKRKDMQWALHIYRKVLDRSAQGRIDAVYQDYDAAIEARAAFLAGHPTALYIDHGGKTIMTGHGSAGLEIDEQLRALGIDESKKVAVLFPAGAGGPIGIGGALKAARKNVSAVMVQPDVWDAFVRTLQTGKLQKNKRGFSSETEIPHEFTYGVATDGPEMDAVEIGRKVLDAAVVVSERRAYEIAGPKIFKDLSRLRGEKNVKVGGTTAITAEALLTYGRDIPAIRDADVVILFGTEGNISGAIQSHIEKAAKKMRSELRLVLYREWDFAVRQKSAGDILEALAEASLMQESGALQPWVARGILDLQELNERLSRSAADIILGNAAELRGAVSISPRDLILVKQLLRLHNQPLLRAELKKTFPEAKLGKGNGWIFDGALFDGDLREDSLRVLSMKAQEGELLVAFPSGAERYLPLLKIPGVKSRAYSALRPLNVYQPGFPGALWIISQEMRIKPPASGSNNDARGVEYPLSLYRQSGLSPEEIAVFSEIVLSIESLRRQLGEPANSIFPRMNAQVLQSGIELLTRIAQDLEGRRQMAQAA